MKVLISDNLAPVGEKILREAGLEVDVKTGLPPEELKAIIADYDGLVIRSATKARADIIEAGIKLKVIGRAGIGLDNVDIPAASAKGIVVMNAPDGNAVTAAEHAIAMMTSLARNIPQGPLPTADHERHDALLVAQLAAGDPLAAEQRHEAQRLVDGCPACAALAADLRAVSAAVAHEPVPPHWSSSWAWSGSSCWSWPSGLTSSPCTRR